MALKQSFCIPMYRDPNVSLNELLSAVKAVGFAATECWGRDENWSELVETAHANGLVVASMCGHGTLGDGMNNPANHSRIVDELKESIDLAVANEVPGLICFSGNRRPGLTDEEGMANCAACMKQIAPYAEEKGINLNMELLNSKVDHPGYMCDHAAWGVAMCKQVGSSRVKLLYDIYHMQIMEGDIIRTIRESIDYIGHFHTAGNPGRKDMDDTQELNYVGICRAIAELGYDLYIGHEFSPKADKIAALKAAYALCTGE